VGGGSRHAALFVWHHLQAAADLLVGTHDFTQFSNDSAERLRRNPVKTLQRYEVLTVAPNHVRLEVSRPKQTLVTGC
jgi:tRNA U38,U39,U40 pseudouridine synthase TruA